MCEYWWPEVRKFVMAYVKGCATCQSTKPNTVCPKPLIMPIISEQVLTPFHTIAMDLTTDLPVLQGYDSILTVVDHGCSKAAIFLPCHKTINAVGIAVLYMEWIFPFYGIPRCIISDQDLCFMAQFIKGVCMLLNIDQNISTAYHSQTNGQSERANQQVEQYLHVYGNSEQNDWVSLLPLAQFMHNTWVNESTGQTPFDLLIGHTPTIPAETLNIMIPEIARRKEWLEHNWLRAQAALRNA